MTKKVWNEVELVNTVRQHELLYNEAVAAIAAVGVEVKIVVAMAESGTRRIITEMRREL